jgi:uncharacterized repeat protein (TIGR01451 family)
VTFEVQVPWDQLRLEPVTEGGKAYTRVSLPGWSLTSQAGAPELPFRAEKVGAPFGAAVSVQVTAGPAHTVALPAPVLPVVTQVVDWGPPAAPVGAPALPSPSFVVQEDPALYGGQAAYPGALAQVAGDGVLRQQRVAGIAAYPVQYNPATGELIVYESLTVSVTFEGGSPALTESVPAESPAYENLLRRELLNPDDARGWRQRVAPTKSQAKEADLAGAQQVEGLTAAEAELEATPWAPPVPGWRVKVREEGFYRLTYTELGSAGLPVNTSLPISTFQLYHLGIEVAIHIDDVDTDGLFDAEDSLLFYGQAPASKYTADNVYWLTYGQGTGLRMGTRSAAPGTAATPIFYRAQRHVEQSATYLPRASGDEDLERFLWDYSYPPSKPSTSYTFSLAAPYSGDHTATLRMAMFGGLSDTIDPDHHTQVYLNGTLVEDAWWDGLVWRVTEIQVPQSLLVAGGNTVELLCPNDTGVGVDAVAVDWLELGFASNFLAKSDELAFGYRKAGTWKFQVSGFSSDGVVVYDVTDPAAVVLLEGLAVNQVGPTYTAEFEDPVVAPTSYWALAGTAYRTVQAIEADTASNLQSTANGADHITISHEDFMSQAQRLAGYRASQGLRAVAVDVQDVYDEFGYGLVGAAPIHDFLAYAYANWQAPAPSYVVLFGDGHYDPKNYLGYGTTSYIPPYLAPVDPWLGEIAADNRYVTLVGNDNMPDMMLGRLAVNRLAEAIAFVNKIITYEQSPEPGDWQTQVLAVTDNADAEGNFPQISDGVLNCCVPDSYSETKVYYGVTHTTVADARTAILDGINAGKLFVNYIGHAGINGWASEALFTVYDVAGLTNGAKLPVMLPMTCYDGYYFHPFAGYSATAEVITRTGGKGAVASWSPTGLGVATGHDHLNRGFLEAVLVDGGNTVGAATMDGKLNLSATGANLELIDTYVLFGDPALYINPVNADLRVAKTVDPAGIISPGDNLTYTLTFHNDGPATAHDVVLTDLVPSQLDNPTVIFTSPEVEAQRPGAPFTWDIADLPPGESGEIRIRATVPLDALPGTITNEVEITAAEYDQDETNNRASVASLVIISGNDSRYIYVPIAVRHQR